MDRGLNNFFDKVYVITCEDFTERHVHIRKHFNKLNIKFEFKSSIDKRFFNEDVISDSEKSLKLSHINCIIDAKLNDYRSILICEDDILFIDTVVEEMTKFMGMLPDDWYYLQLGNQSWATQWLRRVKIFDNVYRFYWGTGSHCIGINRVSYDYTIRNLETMLEPLDISYYHLFNILPCYCPEVFFADAISKNNHLNYINSNLIFESRIYHKKIEKSSGL